MRYIDYKRLCQDREKNRMKIKAKTLFLLCLISGFIWWALFSLFSCGSSQYGHRSRVTDPPIYLIAEYPSIKIMQPEGRKVGKEPKEGKRDYVIPDYKRETNYYK